ncbi:MAG: DEAD/DEAH box helicase [Phycisphaerales bacterium]|nr:DEAD/DEAH box helicase [Phycisphaerales bacterium]
MLVVLHANWHNGSVHVWGESAERFVLIPVHDGSASSPDGDGGCAVVEQTLVQEREHVYALSASELKAVLLETCGLSATRFAGEDSIRLRLPRDLLGPWPSDRLGSVVGGVDHQQDAWLGEFNIPTLRLSGEDPLGSMLELDHVVHAARIQCGHSIPYVASLARFILELLSDQRFIPTLRTDNDGHLTAAWKPWLLDEETTSHLVGLIHGMPPVLRSVVGGEEDPQFLFEEMTGAMAEASIRRTLIDDDFIESLEDWEDTDPHVAWLRGLLHTSDAIGVNGDFGHQLFLDVRRWIGRLDEIDRDRVLRGCLVLESPEHDGGAVLPSWRIRIALETCDRSTERLEAEDIWQQTSDVQRLCSDPDLDARELLIGELGRAARLYPPLEPLLSEATPCGIDISTSEACTFLEEYRPLLEESGFGVIVPDWWGAEDHLVGMRLQIDSPEESELDPETERSLLGLQSLINYRWQITAGRTSLTIKELELLAKQNSSIVWLHDRWVQIDPEQVRTALAFFANKESTEMSLAEAIRLASGQSDHETGLPIWGVDATGWVGQLFGDPGDDTASMTMVEQPERFVGTLRPYQLTGVSWLSFLDRFGLGACLADDMGLGKTVQLIALLQHERRHGDSLAPSLLVVPTSVMGNWARELERFACELKVHVQHGPTRPTGEEFAETIKGVDVVITTYALIVRDLDSFNPIDWHRVVLDEAQYIKNPPTKQTVAIRGLKASRRIALTGTPVENRLTELWSIMEFCNPGYLGEAGDFRRRFARPIERQRDSKQADHLRRLVQPFILRRLKTDRSVISDLPGCVETKEYATLTTEQCEQYEKVVKQMIDDVDRSSGIQRRGLILSLLGQLKQICNHPAQMSGQEELNRIVSPDGTDLRQLSSRSGKARRLMTLLEEVLATGEQALVFTQYRRMGRLLSGMIEHDLGCETMFLHGGTPVPRRQKMIDRFQLADGSAPVFVLSLKAGGLGLNLTAANHVFHYDRWWNPAVERQATDRAYRIGQERTVHVHKFVCQGTLEERIDQMLEDKTALAEHIIGVGDSWLTEMSTMQLREVLQLNPSAMEFDA